MELCARDSVGIRRDGSTLLGRVVGGGEEKGAAGCRKVCAHTRRDATAR